MSLGLSASELESSLRRSQSLAASTTNASARQQQASMAQTQRLISVLQSHPITRPTTQHHQAAAASPFASSAAASPQFHRSSSGSDDPVGLHGFDVLDGFRRELERVRRDVHAWSHSERVMEERQTQRLNDLYAQSARASSSSPPPSRFSHSAAAPAPGKTPSGALLSSISSILHSPKLQPKHGSPLRRRSSTSASPKRAPASVVGAAARMRESAAVFGLAPRDVQAPFGASAAHAASARYPSMFAASATTAPAGSAASDPHISLLAARGSSLLSSQSTALSASTTKLQNVLTGLHMWKEARQAELLEREAEVHARKARGERELVERYERERQHLEERCVQEVTEARRQHARLVEQHVQELNAAVETEFKRHGAISEGFQVPQTTSVFSSSAMHPASSASSSSLASSARFGSFDHSMRLEHLDGGGQSNSLSSSTSTTRSHHQRNAVSDSDDDRRESVRAAERRQRIKYAPALSGSQTRANMSASAGGHSATGHTARRQTVQDLLYSSADEAEEREDDATRQRNELIQKASFLKRQKEQARFGSSSRGSAPGANLAVSFGVAGRSRGRSQKERSHQRSLEERQRSEARVLLESSTDDDDEEESRVDPGEAAYARERHAASVRFAESASAGGRTGGGVDGPRASPNSTRPRRSEKTEAAAVFQETSSDDDGEGDARVAPIASEARNTLQTQREAQAKSAATAGVSSSHHHQQASSGRLHTTPAKVARDRAAHAATAATAAASPQPMTLKDRAQVFQSRVAKMQRQSSAAAQQRNTAPTTHQSRSSEDEEQDE